MKKFESLDSRKVSEVEASIREKFLNENILEKSTRKEGPDYVFYDGPIYANAAPGIHHVFNKAIKDSITKYQIMKGKKILRKIGLDTHGLPIEVNVEKKLGFKSKADIEAFGVENFCIECNKATATNIDEINKVTHMMGQFIDCDNPYITCTNDYIESEWWIIKEMHKKGLIYHGSKVLPYCPRCGTELATHEVAQGYKEVSVNTVIVPFKKSDEDVYFLVWTTTPWTLLANLALCVNPDLTYIKAESMGYKFIVAESLANKVLGDEYKVLETYKGTDLVGIKYDQLLPFVKVEGKAFEVIADKYVTADDGTGIVHIAPAYGADDNRVCIENDITFINPVGKDGCYTEGPWKGRVVTDSELELDIIKYLKENDKLFKKIKMTHEYPHCWRCKSPLLYYAKPAWYVKNTAYKDEIIKANEKINWYPDYVGKKRFANWLENMIDWGISRNRYWGCPIPIWVCPECGKFDVIGSLDELQERVVEDVNVRDIELHRPYIDNIHIKCECGHIMDRVTDVMDVWFDSGVMPYAQFHYPFENKELFESQFPADFIAEGVDQTRGWFYVLLVISTIISGESSFKNVVVNDMMLDANGKKMSKSTGNIIDPVGIMEEYGADTVRWYMMYASPIWTPLKFDYEGLKEVYSKFFNPLKNTYNFFTMYANTDNIDIDECNISVQDRDEIDRWLLSRYNNLLKDVTKAYDEFDLNKVTRLITSFVSDDLSNWYIRRNRNRFWGSELNTSKKSVYITTYEVLVGLSKMIAPIIPYLSEEMYTKLTDEYSVHTADFPKYDESLIDLKLEEKMDYVRNLISMGRMVREETKIKVRTPLSEAIIDSKVYNKIKDLVPLIKEELNVKEVISESDLSKYMNMSVKPNYKEVGKVFGAKIKDFEKFLNEHEVSDLNTEELEFEGTKITKDMFEVKISSKEGFNVSVLDNLFIILNTTLTDELISEGNAREFVSKIQNLRKTNNYEVSDRINIYYKGDEFKKVILDNEEYIKNETLAISIEEKDIDTNELDVNGIKVFVELEKR
jgi:isoleucyl-tRNA synthetase